MSDKADSNQPTKADFERAASEERLTLWQEFSYFLSENKKWWLLPMLLVMGAVAALAWFANTGFAPFIYAVW